MPRKRRDPVERYLEKIDKRGPDECWPWKAACFDRGYGAFRLDDKQLKAHRFGYQALVGQIPDGMVICHRCDNPPCQNPNHWFLGSTRDNAVDREQKGRGRYRHIGPLPAMPKKGRARGERTGSAVLTEASARELKRRFKSETISQQALADEFGVSQGTVSQLVRGLTWTHLRD